MDCIEVINLQRRARVRVGALEAFAERLRRRLALGRRNFDVCLADDRAIRKLNAEFRGRLRATDVLSFPAVARDGEASPKLANFLGDVVISVETARRNARAEGHSLENELRWLLLHGVLHLLGYDHEKDSGEMSALELSLRERLGISGVSAARRKRATPRGIIRP